MSTADEKEIHVFGRLGLPTVWETQDSKRPCGENETTVCYECHSAKGFNTILSCSACENGANVPIGERTYELYSIDPRLLARFTVELFGKPVHELTDCSRTVGDTKSTSLGDDCTSVHSVCRWVFRFEFGGLCVYPSLAFGPTLMTYKAAADVYVTNCVHGLLSLSENFDSLLRGIIRSIAKASEFPLDENTDLQLGISYSDDFVDQLLDRQPWNSEYFGSEGNTCPLCPHCRDLVSVTLSRGLPNQGYPYHLSLDEIEKDLLRASPSYVFLFESLDGDGENASCRGFPSSGHCDSNVPELMGLSGGDDSVRVALDIGGNLYTWNPSQQ